MSEPAVATRQRRKEARPGELIDAALELFVEKGFSATRIEEVAHRAGVSKGTLYLYFPSKEALLKAVISERVSSEISAGAQQAERFKGPMSELLLTVMSQWWLRTLDGPVSGVFKIIVSEVRNFPEIGEQWVREVIEPGERLVGTILERGIATGEFRPVDVPTAVHSLVLPMVMLCLHKHSLGACAHESHDLDPRGFVTAHLELMLHGLVADPGATRGGRSGQAPSAAAPRRRAAR